MELTKETEQMLRDYLLSHEVDIAAGENDFDELSMVFKEIFGREPVWEPPLSATKERYRWN